MKHLIMHYNIYGSFFLEDSLCYIGDLSMRRRWTIYNTKSSLMLDLKRAVQKLFNPTRDFPFWGTHLASYNDSISLSKEKYCLGEFPHSGDGP